MWVRDRGKGIPNYVRTLAVVARQFYSTGKRLLRCLMAYNPRMYLVYMFAHIVLSCKRLVASRYLACYQASCKRMFGSQMPLELEVGTERAGIASIM